MSFIGKLAMRNVGRNKRRSLLAALSVGLAALFIVFMQGMTGGFLDSIVRNYTKSETGHIRITTKKFEEDARFSPVSDNIADPSAVIQRLRADPAVADEIAMVTQRVRFGVLLSNGQKNKSAAALAGDPAAERELLMLHKSIRSGGRYLEGSREMIIGCSLADALGFTLGDTVKVVATGSDHALHMRTFVIVGVFETGLNALDEAVFQIGLDDARALLRMKESAQQIIVMLDDYRRAEAVASSMRANLDADLLAVTPWTAIGDYGKMVDMANRVYTLMYYAVALLGAFIITNILLMVVMERRKEIGIMKSMGFRASEILALFVTEGAILGAAGSACGAALGVAVTAYFHVHGVDFTALSGSFHIPMDNVIYFNLDPANALGVVAMGTAISALVSIGPSRKAARMNAVEAIKSA
jgi:putative ABC transport system permease protein